MKVRGKHVLLIISVKRTWQEENLNMVKNSQKYTNKRFVVLHDGTSDKFDENTGLLFSIKSNSNLIRNGFMKNNYKY